MQTETYPTEKEAKKAAARDYRPAIVRLPNGRYGCFHAGDILPQGARAVSRWDTDQWRAYDQQEVPCPQEEDTLDPGAEDVGILPGAQ